MAEVNGVVLDERDEREVWGVYSSRAEASPAQQTEEERMQDLQAARTKHVAIPAIPSYAAPRVVHPTSTPLMAKVSEVPAMASRVPHPSDTFEGQLQVGAPAVANRSTLNGVGALPANRAATRKRAEEGEELEAYSEALEAVASHLDESPKEPSFPYPALEAILAVAAKEAEVNEKLRGYVKEMDKLQEDLHLLLDLNTKLNAIKEDVQEMPADLRALLDQLKERGMEIWPSGKTEFSKEIKSDIKAMSSSHQDRAKSNLHIITSAKIQSLTAIISALCECAKDIARRDDAAKRKFLTPPGH